jgi:hypothetical protein
MYASACNGGYAYACGDLGRLYVDGIGVATDLPRAVPLLERACDAGHAASCATVARVYRAGNASAADLADSAHFEDKACQLGAQSSCSMLASAYRLGRGVTRDETHAQQLYESACAGGDALGCSNIGKPRLALLREGWCMHDNWSACADVARQYDSGDGVVRESSRAATFYEIACTHGDGPSCGALARFHRDAYAQLACALGQTQSCRTK